VGGWGGGKSGEEFGIIWERKLRCIWAQRGTHEFGGEAGGGGGAHTGSKRRTHVFWH
jgi:hypothetical protein